MPVDKVICVGKNYLDHAKELGDLVPAMPVLFIKPASVIHQASAWGEELKLYFPRNETNVQPECEIVIQVANDGFNMTIDEAKRAIANVTLGLDMTLRTRQSQLKKEGHPWTTAKVFKDSAVLGPWIPYDQFPDYLNAEFQLIIDKVCRQRAMGSAMMMNPENLLVYISQFFPIKAGDIIYTGTPAGVSAIHPGAHAELRWSHCHYSVVWAD